VLIGNSEDFEETIDEFLTEFSDISRNVMADTKWNTAMAEQEVSFGISTVSLSSIILTIVDIYAGLYTLGILWYWIIQEYCLAPHETFCLINQHGLGIHDR